MGNYLPDDGTFFVTEWWRGAVTRLATGLGRFIPSGRTWRAVAEAGETAV